MKLTTEREVRRLLHLKRQVSQEVSMGLEIRHQDAGRIFLWFALLISSFSFDRVLTPKPPSQVANQVLKHMTGKTLS